MKARFQQYFRPTKEELDALLKNAIISYDANLLLNVYRYSGATREGLEEVFRVFADRTQLTHQATLEYARNREKIIFDQVKQHQKAEETLGAIIKEFTEPQDKQPFLSSASCRALEDVMKELTEKRSSLEAMVSEDRYVDLLHELFENKICAAPDDGALKVMHKRAAERIESKIPPGYADLKEKGEPGAYGDYVLWCQLIDIAKAERRDLILVTDESKEDWLYKLHGRTIGPRPELREEFLKESGQRVWLYSTKSFLIAAKRAGSTEVSDEVIEEVGAYALASASASDKKPSLIGPDLVEDGFDPELHRSDRQTFSSEVIESSGKLTRSSAQPDLKKPASPHEDSAVDE